MSDFDFGENSSGSEKQIDNKGAAFRRIFFRAADSVRLRSGDFGGAVNGGKYLFYGMSLKSEYDSVSPWYSQRCVSVVGMHNFCMISCSNQYYFHDKSPREMEENMVEEAEISGDLYLRAGIVESSRYAWGLANQFYSETFNYARLAYVYGKLANVVTTQIPFIDVTSNNQLDLSSQLGKPTGWPKRD